MRIWFGRDRLIDDLIAAKGARCVPGMEAPDYQRVAAMGQRLVADREARIVEELVTLRRYRRGQATA